MPKAVTYGKTERMSFARHEEIQSMPNLLEIQKNSYKWFLEEYPGVIDRVPHSRISSFLGMSPITLSRVRANI